jgi:outer membrane protein TolC
MKRFFIFLGIFAVSAILGLRSFGGTETTRSSSETRSGRGTTSSSKVPTFTLDQAILTALQQNPTLLEAEQEIKRTKGVIIQVRAQALPQVNANAEFEWIDRQGQGPAPHPLQLRRQPQALRLLSLAMCLTTSPFSEDN